MLEDFEIDVAALAQLRDEGTPHTLLDVREPAEIETCVIEDSLTIPMQQIPQALAALPHDQPLVVLCHHGTRSAMVTEFLRSNGFGNAVNLVGGIDAWARSIDPSMRRY
jgi:rhodanese-related sulfurtransferase